jgi:uncharacterized membrane protein
VNVEINDQDRLMAALAWIIFPIALVILFVEDMRNRPFQKFHAVNSIAFWVVLMVIGSIISTVTCGIGGVLFLLGFVAFYWAFQAYQGVWVEVPFLTDFVKKQGWI